MFFTDKYLLTRNAKPGLKAQEIPKTRISLLLFSAIQIIVSEKKLVLTNNLAQTVLTYRSRISHAKVYEMYKIEG